MPKLNPVITGDDIDCYKRQGVLHLKGVVPEELLIKAQAPLERWVNRKINNWYKKEKLTDKYKDLSFDRRIVAAWNQAGRPHYDPSPTDEIVSREMFDLMRHSVFIEIACALAGSKNLALHGRFHCRPKLPDQTFTDTPWHQDAQCQPLMADTGAVIIWIPLMDVNENNACLAFDVGGHQKGLYRVYDDPTGYYVSMHPDDCKTLDNVVPMPMKRGDLLCFNEMIPHRAMLNKTDAARWSVDFRFERLDVAGSIALRNGFICSHEDISKIETSYENWIEQKWPDKNKAAGSAD